MKPDNDPVLKHFVGCLTTAIGRDKNRRPTIAKGDCTVMLQLVRMKLDDFDEAIDRSNPGRFRGTTQLEDDMRTALGDLPAFHIPKWGASHVRGSLRDDDKRGNKRHIIQLIDILNDYAGTGKSLRIAYASCIRKHHEFWESFSLTVSVQPQDSFQTRLFKLLSVASLGRVQQGLVYSTLRRRYGNTRGITTKKTFAGDDQSSRHGLQQLGDVQVMFGNAPGIAVEVKDAIVDARVWKRVADTHGEHDYALFVLATSFQPKELQFDISSHSNTFALHLADFLLAIVFVTASDERKSPVDVLSSVIDIYNNDFCAVIEKDTSISIAMDVR